MLVLDRLGVTGDLVLRQRKQRFNHQGTSTHQHPSPSVPCVTSGVLSEVRFPGSGGWGRRRLGSHCSSPPDAQLQLDQLIGKKWEGKKNSTNL